MRRGICAATLCFESIVLGLSTPVMIAVEDVHKGLALSLGLGLAMLAVVTAGLLRHPWAYVIGHLIQVGAVGLGFFVPIMFVVGGIFAALWVTAYLLGTRIEADRAAWAAENPSDAHD